MRTPLQSIFNTPDTRTYEPRELVPKYIWMRKRKESTETLRLENGRKLRDQNEGSLRVKLDFTVMPLSVSVLIFPAFTFKKEESRNEDLFVVFSSRYYRYSECNWLFRHLKVNIILAFMYLKCSLTYQK